MKPTITIRIKADRRGKLIAHYWGQARRWLPLSVDAARLALSTGSLFGCPVVEHEVAA